MTVTVTVYSIALAHFEHENGSLEGPQDATVHRTLVVALVGHPLALARSSLRLKKRHGRRASNAIEQNMNDHLAEGARPADYLGSVAQIISFEEERPSSAATDGGCIPCCAGASSTSINDTTPDYV